MKRSALALVGLLVVSLGHAADAPIRGLTAVPFPDVQIHDSFWSPRIRTNSKATVEANLHQCEITHRIRNFAIAGKLEPGKHKGRLYNDSDVYKVLEGVAYTLISQRDENLEKRTDAIIDKIAAAQQPDGYLNTYFTLVKPEERWKNIQYGHELYCAGHLIEAAVAYHQATGKRKLLDVAIKFADHIADTFGPGKKIDATGHEETRTGPGEALSCHQRQQVIWSWPNSSSTSAVARISAGCSANMPRTTSRCANRPRSPATPCGRCTSTAAWRTSPALTGDKTLLEPLEKIWHDVVDRKMYLTGGIGPSASNEGFTVPYDLPNDSAYAETCAAIGMALWNHRMFLLTGDGKYADVLEREVYNGLVSGVSLGGDRFFYTNPLGSVGKHHRVPWFGTSCCPTNIVRYVAGHRRTHVGDARQRHLERPLRRLHHQPHAARRPGQAHRGYRLSLEGRHQHPGRSRQAQTFDLHLRIPGWCQGEPTITVNGEAVKKVEKKAGYVTLSRTWKSGDVVRLELPMPVQRIYADPNVKANAGRVALDARAVGLLSGGRGQRRPGRNFVLPKDKALTATFEPKLLGGVVVVRGEALAVGLNADEKTTTSGVKFQAVPYCCWDNREPGPMVVWLAEKPEAADLPPEVGVLSNGVRIKASHCWQNDTVTALNDGKQPKLLEGSRPPAHDLVGQTRHDGMGGVPLQGAENGVGSVRVLVR